MLKRLLKFIKEKSCEYVEEDKHIKNVIFLTSIGLIAFPLLFGTIFLFFYMFFIFQYIFSIIFFLSICFLIGLAIANYPF